MKPLSKQRIGKHESETIGLLLEAVFSIRSLHSSYKEHNWGNLVS
jgi:hypothetical protein